MASSPYSEQEQNDSKSLSQAIDAIQRGDNSAALQRLEAIIANTPPDYRYSYEREDGALVVKFWDQEDFMYYVASQSPQREIVWVLNAYGKAHFYRGFLSIKMGEAFDALQWLDKGITLEPEKPFFYLEKGKAFQMLKQPEAALEEYEHVLALGDLVPPTPRAVALRGRGFQLIELDRLDEAERAFRESLRIAPNNDVALGELEYIRHLREGGQKAPSEVTEVGTASKPECAVCGAPQGDTGRVLQMDGQLIFLCEKCNREMEAATQKKWWQFWRR